VLNLLKKKDNTLHLEIEQTSYMVSHISWFWYVSLISYQNLR